MDAVWSNCDIRANSSCRIHSSTLVYNKSPLIILRNLFVQQQVVNSQRLVYGSQWQSTSRAAARRNYAPRRIHVQVHRSAIQHCHRADNRNKLACQSQT
jgi:hypothetical protein